MISRKQLQTAFVHARTAGERKQCKKDWDIFNIAAATYDRERVSEATFEEARKVYFQYRKLNRLNDTLLILDNDEYWHNKAYTKSLHEKADLQEVKVKKMMKRFGLHIVYHGYLASINYDCRNKKHIHGGYLYLNYCL